MARPPEARRRRRRRHDWHDRGRLGHPHRRRIRRAGHRPLGLRHADQLPEAARVVAEGAKTTVTVPVKLRQAVVCTITNTLKAATAAVTPKLECVVFRNAAPDVAVWGYSNPNSFPVTIPLGSAANGFDPAPLDRGQPVVFDPGPLVGAFQTPFGGAATLTWSLGGKTVTASSTSPRCTATIELRKVTVPADDPGVFNLLINGASRRPARTGRQRGRSRSAPARERSARRPPRARASGTTARRSPAPATANRRCR